MRPCGCADDKPASQPQVLSALYGEAAIRRRMRCDDCARTWTQIEVREEGEGRDADR